MEFEEISGHDIKRMAVNLLHDVHYRSIVIASGAVLEAVAGTTVRCEF